MTSRLIFALPPIHIHMYIYTVDLLEAIKEMSTDDCLADLNWLVEPSAGMLSIHPPTPPPTPVAPLHHVQIPVRPKEIDFKRECIKPPYSYAQLITMAMSAHPCDKVVLTDIYLWIRENFAFFRGKDNSWQNSIRHNLSLNRQFIKVPRDPNDKGKGSYWMLDRSCFAKDPYCIRRRNFFDSQSRRARPEVDRPQINPAIKSFLEKTQRIAESRRHPFAGAGEKLEDIGAQECVYTDSNPGFDDFNQKLFKQEVEQLAAYVPQNDLVNANCQLPPTIIIPQSDDRPPQEKVRVEYNWEGYEYHPSNLNGVQLPVQLSPGSTLDPCKSNSSVGLSPPNSEESDEQPTLNLRIPTPEWWGHNVTTASLLSPLSGSSNGTTQSIYPLAKVFENMSSPQQDAATIHDHPWQSITCHQTLFDNFSQQEHCTVTTSVTSAPNLSIH